MPLGAYRAKMPCTGSMECARKKTHVQGTNRKETNGSLFDYTYNIASQEWFSSDAIDFFLKYSPIFVKLFDSVFIITFA